MDKWIALSEHMIAEEKGALLKTRLVPEALKAAFDEGRAVALERKGLIIAYGALWPEAGSFEVGSMFVLPPYRGRRLSSEVMHALIEAVSPGEKVFIVTHNDRIVRLAHKHHFVEAGRTNWTSTIPWEASCAPCSFVSDTEKPQCPFRAVATECRLFFRVK